MASVDVQQIWKGFHWSFFINIQGLIICLKRFEVSMISGNLPNAQLELETATDLMLASGASMELASSFSKQAYADKVRPSMAPPHVQSHDFSGLMSWEHASLIQIWKRLQPIFEMLPVELHPHHEKFVNAYIHLATSHRAVCQKFGGDTAGSLRYEQGRATEVLDKFKQKRLSLIDPKHRVEGCPFHCPKTIQDKHRYSSSLP